MKKINTERKFTCKYKLRSCYFLFYQNELRAYSSIIKNKIQTNTHTHKVKRN